jgi:hypothetical protein
MIPNLEALEQTHGSKQVPSSKQGVHHTLAMLKHTTLHLEEFLHAFFFFFWQKTLVDCEGSKFK